MTLEPDLILRLGRKIAEPSGRSDEAPARAGASRLPIDDIQRKFNENMPGAGDGIATMREQMARWGFNLESMNFKDMGGGHLSASSGDPDAPLSRPPGEARLDDAEATMRLEIPEGVRQLYGLADGGFGPGLGLFALQALIGSYEDICRRGPDWTGEIEWPRRLLPIFGGVMLPSPVHDFETAQIVSIDTVDGTLVTFDEDWDQDGLTPATAWSVVSPDLSAFLEDWLSKAH